ncbi:hypothetical protein L1N85_14625 [Paenibacillus alkaliterrae]|uniref:hypothetical protein n=1 Tax=Paenibacillus alkaliterrae TaxID=320909 RepID=UPI001F39FD39|nr:hypothetical protein [Paenibacillus alkaliterrae]MCF2939655.1 hypothetical protein [Paenibacillus alkaliterrae]
MLCPSSNHVPFLTDQSSSLNVSRIELFVIPALAIDSAGYRVCLRLTSNLGFGWSELFIGDTDEMIDLERYSDLLVSFIGSVSLPLLRDFIYDESDHEGRALDLFAAAIQHVTTRSADSASVAGDTEEHVLRGRAVNYVSLF